MCWWLTFQIEFEYIREELLQIKNVKGENAHLLYFFSKLSSALVLRISERGSVCLEAYSSSQVHSFQFASLSLRRASLLNLIFFKSVSF